MSLQQFVEFTNFVKSTKLFLQCGISCLLLGELDLHTHTSVFIYHCQKDALRYIYTWSVVTCKYIKGIVIHFPKTAQRTIPKIQSDFYE